MRMKLVKIARKILHFFYEHYKAEKNIPKAYLDAVNAYKFQYPSVENVKQHFHPKDEVEKLTHSEIANRKSDK